MKEFMDLILTRRSIRRFKNEQISEKELNEVLQAGSYAPTGKNVQSFKITAIFNREKVEKLNKDIDEVVRNIVIDEKTPKNVADIKNRPVSENTQYLYTAPAFIIVSNEAENYNAMADSTCVMENMMLYAHAIGLGTCWINILVRLNDCDGVREILDKLYIPKSHKICGCLSIGYPDIEPKVPNRKEGLINIIK